MGETCISQTLVSASGALLVPFPIPSSQAGWAYSARLNFPGDGCLLA